MTDSLSPTMPLTEARAQLFRLAEHVRSGAVDRVRLTHRSHPEDLLLVRASAVSQLEREIKCQRHPKVGSRVPSARLAAESAAHMGRLAPRHAVLDTHALLWWLAGRMRSLGRSARAFVERVDAGDAVAHVPSVALAEVSEAIRRGVFSLNEPFETFVQRLENTPSRYRVVPLDAAIVARSHELFAIPERGDRLIAATAQQLGFPLLTRDPEIGRAIGGDVLW